MSRRPSNRNSCIAGAIAVSIALVAGGCDQTDPKPAAFGGELVPIEGETSYFERFDTFAVASGADAAPLEAEVAQFIGSAEFSVDVALAHLESLVVAEALIAARDRKVPVRVAADIDVRGEAGFVALEAAGLPVVYGDGALQWNPQPTVEVAREGAHNLMTHSTVIVDRTRVLNLSGGFTVRPTARVGFRAVGEDIGFDFGDAIDQLLGGVFATTLTLYGATVVSDPNNQTFYPVEDGVIELWFGPGEPLIKQLIDEIYSARGSVDLATEALQNAEIIYALRYKAEAGFRVRVVIDTEGRDAAFSRADALVGFFDEIRAAHGTQTPSIVFVDGVAGTMMVTDTAPSPVDGKRTTGKAFVMSGPLVSSVPFEQRDADASSRTGASFTDANMWTVHERGVPAINEDFVVLRDAFEVLFSGAAGATP